MATLEPGQLFGKYRIIRLLGRGGMGAVYLAVDTSLERQVALKVLAGPALSDPHFETRLRNEARIIAQLEHPRIVQIHALERIDDRIAVDMVYVEGGTLLRCPAQADFVVQRACEVLDALACCHAEGIVHRDVKPSNILLSRNGHAMLSDFGLAKLLALNQPAQQMTVTSSCFFIGTPLYAPPESWTSIAPTAAWDVYSVGMVLYERLSPITPYVASSPMAFLKQLTMQPLPPLREMNDDISPELSDSVTKMLAHDLAERPQNAAQALELLRQTPESASESGPFTPFGTVGDMSVTTRLRNTFAVSTSMRQRLRSALVEGKARYLGVGALLVASLLLLAYVQHINSQQSGPAIGVASDPQTFDTIVPSTAQLWPQHWMMKRGENPENWTVLAAADTHLWTMTASPLSEGKVHFEGYWADYSNAGGLLFRHGSLSGTGTWLRVGEMAVALEMDNLLDGSHREEALLLRPSATQPRETEYLQKLDHANYLPALIFGEVAPRHLPWLGNLRQTWWDGVFKILPAARAAQPLADIGALDAAVWNYSRSRPPDWVSPTKPGNFSLSALYDDRFLLFSCTLPSQTQFVTAQLTLFCSIDAETHRSPRWEATIRSDAIVNSAYVSRGGPLPWSCSWQAWSQQNGESSRITLRIPFESLAETTPPSNGNFWRVNWVIRGGDTVDAPAVARWGNEDLAQIDRAIVLEFE